MVQYSNGDLKARLKKPVYGIEIVANLEVACYKKKARLEYKVFTYRFTNS